MKSKDNPIINLPAVSLSLTLAIGISIGKYFENSFAILLQCAAASIVLSICLFLLHKFKKATLISLHISIVLSLFASMALYTSFTSAILPKETVLQYVNQKIIISGNIITSPSTDKATKFVLDSKTIQLTSKETIATEGKIQVLVKKKTSSLEIGKSIAMSGNLQLAQNYSSFDYRKYLFENNIVAVLYVPDESHIIAIPSLLSWFDEYIIYPIYRYISNAIETLYPVGDVRSFIKGMILGERASISKEVMEAFQHTGTIHILSISGLHIALLVIILNIFFTRLKIYTVGKVICFVLLSMMLIIYSNVTANSSPVLRAVIMAILFELIDIYEKPSFPINTLFVAVVVILLLNPLNLYSISFHLTVCAMFGILWIHPRLYAFVSKKIKGEKKKIHPFLHYIIEIASVTISATLMTFPFSAYYFQNIPLLGLLANMFAVDIFSISIYFILAALMFYSVWTPLAILYASVSQWLVDFGIQCVLFFNSLSLARIEVKIDLLMMLLIFSAIAILVLYEYKHLRWKSVSFFLLLCNIYIWRNVWNDTEEYFHSLRITKEVMTSLVQYKNAFQEITIHTGRARDTLVQDASTHLRIQKQIVYLHMNRLSYLYLPSIELLQSIPKHIAMVHVSLPKFRKREYTLLQSFRKKHPQTTLILENNPIANYSSKKLTEHYVRRYALAMVSKKNPISIRL